MRTYFDQPFGIITGVQKQQVVANAFGQRVGFAERFAREQKNLAVRPELVVSQTVAQPLQTDHIRRDDVNIKLMVKISDAPDESIGAIWVKYIGGAID